MATPEQRRDRQNPTPDQPEAKPESRFIIGSPWADRTEFSTQLEESILPAIKEGRIGEICFWRAEPLSRPVSLTVTNYPENEIGPHIVMKLHGWGQEAGIEINTGGPGDIDEEMQTLDMGDGDQITRFIEISARALERGLPPDIIINAAIDARPRLEDRVQDRGSYCEANLRDFSRRLSEAQFL